MVRLEARPRNAEGTGRGDDPRPGDQRAAHAARPHRGGRVPRRGGAGHAAGHEHGARRLAHHAARELAGRVGVAPDDHGALRGRSAGGRDRGEHRERLRRWSCRRRAPWTGRGSSRRWRRCPTTRAAARCRGARCSSAGETEACGTWAGAPAWVDDLPARGWRAGRRWTHGGARAAWRPERRARVRARRRCGCGRVRGRAALPRRAERRAGRGRGRVLGARGRGCSATASRRRTRRCRARLLARTRVRDARARGRAADGRARGRDHDRGAALVCVVGGVLRRGGRRGFAAAGSRRAASPWRRARARVRPWCVRSGVRTAAATRCATPCPMRCARWGCASRPAFSLLQTLSAGGE